VPTKKDLLDAQSFSRRRLLTAFTSGAPGGKELEPANPLRAVIAGVALAAMVVVGGVFYGLMRPGLPDGWANNTVLLVEDTGARYVAIGGVLYPVINATSARLLLSADSYAPITATADAIKDIPVGPAVGILGAPDDVPAPGDLVDDAWTACAAPDGTAISMPGDAALALATDAALVESDGALYVISSGYRYPLDENSDQVLRQIGLAGVTPTEVESRWLNLFEAGTPLEPLFIDGADQGAMLPNTGLSIGTVVHPQGSTAQFVITADQQLAPISQLGYQLYLLGTGARLGNVQEVTAAELDLPTAAETAEPADWPDDALVPLAASSATCAQLTHDATGRPLTALAVAPVMPESEGVTVGAHSGALVLAAGRGNDTLGMVTLIDESGTAFAIPDASDDVLARLGYTEADIAAVPLVWTQFFASGPSLTIAAAGMTPNGEVVTTPPTDETAPDEASPDQGAATATPEPSEGGTSADAAMGDTRAAREGWQGGVAIDATGDRCEVGNVQYTSAEPPALAQLQADAAWETATGEGTVIAVVDSGIDKANAHLRDAVIGGINLVMDGEPADGSTDVMGHGTAVAGVIAARPVEGSGVVGLAPDAQLLSVRVYRDQSDESQEMGFGPNSQLMAEGIRWAVDHGADVINLSMSDDEPGAALEDASAYAATHGVLIVASAGNRSTTTNVSDSPRYPAAYDGVLAVAAAGTTGHVTDSSIHGAHVDVSAPGQEVVSAFTGGGDCVFAASAASSSYATAYTSAAAALLVQAFPDEGPSQWSYRLTATALRPAADARSDDEGWGFIQPFDAMSLEPGTDARGPQSAFVSGAPLKVEPAAASLEATPTTSPWRRTLGLALAAGTLGAVAFAAFGVVGLWRREPEPLAAPTKRKGLLDAKKESAQTVAR